MKMSHFSPLRIFLNLLLVVGMFTFPFWLFIMLLVAGLLSIPFYYESLVLVVLCDILYHGGTSSHQSFIVLLFMFALFACVEVLRAFIRERAIGF